MERVQCDFWMFMATFHSFWVCKVKSPHRSHIGHIPFNDCAFKSSTLCSNVLLQQLNRKGKYITKLAMTNFTLFPMIIGCWYLVCALSQICERGMGGFAFFISYDLLENRLVEEFTYGHWHCGCSFLRGWGKVAYQFWVCILVYLPQIIAYLHFNGELLKIQ